MNPARKSLTLLVAPLLLILLFILPAAAQRSIVNASYGAGGRQSNVTSRVQQLVQNGLLNFRVGNDTLGGDPAPGQPKELHLRLREWNGRTQELRFREGQNVYLQVSGGSWGGGQWGYHGILAPEWQSKFDSYYTRWLEYQRRNDWGEIQSMERRMRDIMVHYNIPPTVPFEQVASTNLSQPNPGWGGGNWQTLRIISARYGVGGQGTDVTQRLQGMVSGNSLSVTVSNDLFGSDPAPGRRKELWVDYMYQGRRQHTRVAEGNYLRLGSGQSGGITPPPPPNPGIPGGTWQGDPVAVCINAVSSRIRQDYGNNTHINLPRTSARVGSVSVGQLMVPVTGTGWFNPRHQPRANTQYNCEIDKRFGNVSNVNYTRPNVTPQPR